MTVRGLSALAAALAVALVSLPASASGSFIVTKKGVPAYDEAKNGFIQMAYAQQVRGFSPQAIELDGTDKDGPALDALKAKAPDLVFCIGAFAAKKTRQALPDTPIVYSMVYYPETEGLTKDPKMVGVFSLGAPRLTAQVLKSLGKYKSVAVLYQVALAASAESTAAYLSAEGLDATAVPVKGPEELQKVLASVRTTAQVVYLQPDPITLDPEAFRFIISQCISAGLLPVAGTDSLVSNGALFAAYFPPAVTGNKAAEVAALILNSGKVPDQRLVFPAVTDATTALNKSTAQALRLKISKEVSGGTVYE